VRVATIVDKVLDENDIVDRWFATMVVSGPRTATLHAKTSTRKISSGDPVVVDLGPMWIGYDGCIAFTFIVDQNKYWQRVLGDMVEAIRTGLKHVKLDTLVKTLDLVLVNIL